jgi:hypothetical protein
MKNLLNQDPARLPCTNWINAVHTILVKEYTNLSPLIVNLKPGPGHEEPRDGCSRNRPTRNSAEALETPKEVKPERSQETPARL